MHAIPVQNGNKLEFKMSGHTKEPWRTEYQDSPQEDKGHWIYNTAKGGDEYAIAVTFSLNPHDAEDARRIVACVNACAGIKTEALENTADLNSLYSDIIRERDVARAKVIKLEQQRDGLLAACKYSQSVIAQCEEHGISFPKQSYIINAAIASVESK